MPPDPAADEKRRQAVDTVAASIIDRAARNGLVYLGWEHYPGLGTDPWNAVAARVTEVLDAWRPSEQQYQAAYDYLAQRAVEVEQ